MPRPSTTKLSGTPDEPSASCTRLSGRRRSGRTGRRGGRGRRRRPRAGRGSRCRRSPRRWRFSSISSGASAMHGTHQLAKMLTRRGWPVARSAEARPGLPGMRGRKREGRAPACRSACERIFVVGRAAQPPGHRADERDQHEQRQEAQQRGSCERLLAADAAAARSRTSRPTSASRPPSAISTPPSQINVTNGFHHSRSCQRPCSSWLAEHGVELAVPAGVDRGFVGVRSAGR